MPAIAISGNGVSVAPFSPNPAVVSKNTGNVRINGQEIILHGDLVPSHTYLLSTHSAATMVSSQSSIKVNGVNVIIDGDESTCSASHTIVASSGNVSFNPQN